MLHYALLRELQRGSGGAQVFVCGKLSPGERRGAVRGHFKNVVHYCAAVQRHLDNIVSRVERGRIQRAGKAASVLGKVVARDLLKKDIHRSYGSSFINARISDASPAELKLYVMERVAGGNKHVRWVFRLGGFGMLSGVRLGSGLDFFSGCFRRGSHGGNGGIRLSRLGNRRGLSGCNFSWLNRC